MKSCIDRTGDLSRTVVVVFLWQNVWRNAHVRFLRTVSHLHLHDVDEASCCCVVFASDTDRWLNSD